MAKEDPLLHRSLPLATTLVLAAASCLAATAQGPRERPRLALQALDLDHDGTLSAQEIQQAPKSLAALDRNGDGDIEPAELEPPRTDAGATPDELVTRLMTFDRNGDGVLSPDELPERMQPLFTRADANHDGRLTPDEIRRSVAHTGSPNGRPAIPGQATGAMRNDALLNALDLNHDGVISAAEIAAASTSLLALDTNHDGSIEPQEMPVRQPSPQERVAHFLDEFDTNKDGKVSLAEAPDGIRPRFAAADKNNDGFLDRDELLAMFQAQQAGDHPNSSADTSKGQHN